MAVVLLLVFKFLFFCPVPVFVHIFVQHLNVIRSDLLYNLSADSDIRSALLYSGAEYVSTPWAAAATCRAVRLRSGSAAACTVAVGVQDKPGSTLASKNQGPNWTMTPSLYHSVAQLSS